MRRICLFIVLTWLPNVITAQETPIRLKGDAEVYNYALERYVSSRKKEKLVVEWDDIISPNNPKEIGGMRVTYVLPIDYIKLIGKGNLTEVIVQNPIGMKNGVFDVTVCSFKFSYNRKKKELLGVNQGGVRLEMKFDCETGEFIVVSDSSLWK